MVTDLALDRSDDPRIRLNFNITMLDLRCDFAVIDVVSVLGNDQNVTAHVTKWDVDASGVKRTYKGRNRNQKDIDLFDESVTETLEELLAHGEDAISLDPTMLKYFIQEHDYVFVDFYASWCSHCRQLAPTWEVLAEVMVDAGLDHSKDHPDDYSDEDYKAAEKIQMPVVIAKMDCVIYAEFCNLNERIQAYPTLRLFVDGKRWHKGDYNGHRTILEMVEWLYYVEEEHKQLLSAEGDELGDRVRTLHTAHEGMLLLSRSREGFASTYAFPPNEQLSRFLQVHANDWKMMMQKRTPRNVGKTVLWLRNASSFTAGRTKNTPVVSWQVTCCWIVHRAIFTFWHAPRHTTWHRK